MTDNNNSYFTLNNPSLNNKPQPTTNNATTKSGLLNRRQQHASYLPQLELPSLPPLSHLLTTDKAKKEDTNTSEAAVVAAVAAGMMPNLNYPTATTTTTTNSTFYNPTTVTAPPVDTTLMNSTNPIMMDPTMYISPDNMIAAQAAAAAVYNMNNPMPIIQNNTNTNQRQRQLSNSSSSSAEKIYSFVAIPGTNQKKRPRRRYDEIERLYHCNWAGCTKAYGTLNHLNAHVSMQKHGSKRHPAEFKEMRKEWRKQKKEREARKKANEEVMMNINQNVAPPQPSFNNFQPYGQIPTGAMSLNGFY